MVNILLQSKKYSQTKVIGKNFSYDLYIGEVLSELENFIKNSNYRAIRILTDPNLVEAGHLKTLLNLLKNSGKKVSYGIIKAGEQFKHIKYFSEMIAAVDEPELDRKTLLCFASGSRMESNTPKFRNSRLQLQKHQDRLPPLHQIRAFDS